MNERDIFINWLYNNEDHEISDCMCVNALEAFDCGFDEDDLKAMLMNE